MRYVYAAILVLSVISFAMFNSDREYKRDTLLQTNSYIEGLRIVDKKDGRDSWVIVAKRADFTKDETVAKMNAVTIQAVKEGMTLDADTGTYNLTTRELHLDENIRIRIRDSVISAKSLVWNPSTGILTSEDRVLMEAKKFRIEGEGLTATQDQKLKVMKNVKATFY